VAQPTVEAGRDQAERGWAFSHSADGGSAMATHKNMPDESRKFYNTKQLACTLSDYDGTPLFHVLVGQEAAVDTVLQAAAQREAVSWIVPKAAHPGDEVTLFFPHIGFLGRGVVASEPESATFGKRPGYCADVGGISLFAFPVLLETIARRVPKWDWVRYPRSFTTPPEKFADRIRDALIRLGAEAKPDAAARGKGNRP
jgi:hypothetical protein